MNQGVQNLKLYLDVCCLNRPFDDQTQARIRLEAEAVLMILARCEAGAWEWVASEVIALEISRTPDAERRRRVQALASHAHHSVVVGGPEKTRALELESEGFSAFDALHIACAESSEADAFLTTDDGLLRKSAALGKELGVRVENPLTWLKEVA
jgi:predicted nucleic acid-binding protein